MSSVKKSDLVSKIAAQTGLAASDTKFFVDELINTINEELINENTIELRGFGTFDVKKRKPRSARNMTTGEKVFVPERKDITMKPAKELKELVNQ